jgi:hypothetical protein
LGRFYRPTELSFERSAAKLDCISGYCCSVLGSLRKLFGMDILFSYRRSHSTHWLANPAAFLLACFWLSVSVCAQPPGTRPPDAIIDRKPSEDSKVPSVAGFLFLDDSKNPVFMPGMTIDELERLRNLEVGIDSPVQSYAFESLEIDGSTLGARCELTVRIRLNIEGTENRWLVIPLRMKNFFRIADAEVTGLEDFQIRSAEDGSGYLLELRSEAACKAELKLQVSARVSESPSQGVDFVLPDVPSIIRLVTPQSEMVGVVVGRGDEVVQNEPIFGGGTRLVVESGGGSFQLRWGGGKRNADVTPIVEVESNITIDWDSPQDLPLASVQMTVQNLRDHLSSFDVQLPVNSVLLDIPTINSTTSQIEVGAPVHDDQGDRFQIQIPDTERQQRIDLSFDIQLPSNDTTLDLAIPTILGALRHRGEIVVRTSPDFRLRWHSQPWIQAIRNQDVENAGGDRVHRFRFDRATFQLPLTLSAKQRLLRLSSQSEVSLLDGLASLEMTINATGQSADGRGVQLDPGDWNFRSIVDLATGKQLDSYKVDQYPEIELGPRLGDETTSIRIRAEHALPTKDDHLELTLPQIVKSDEDLLVQEVIVQVRSDGQHALVVDLEKSLGLNPVAREDRPEDSNVSRFQLLPPDATALIVGRLVPQTPRISLATETRISLEGSDLVTAVDWTVTSATSLEGRLPIRFAANSGASVPSVANDLPSEIPLAEQLPVATSTAWVVVVDGVPAILRPTTDGLYEIISDRLLSGTISIRLRQVQRINLAQGTSGAVSIELPRPAIQDVSVIGTTRIRMVGDSTADLIGLDSDANDSSSTVGGESQMTMDQLPREPLTVRVRRSIASDGDRHLTVRRAVLRSVLGRSNRHEHLMASVQGGDYLVIALPSGTDDVRYEAFVNQKVTTTERDQDRLQIALPNRHEVHQVELRIWVSEPAPNSFAEVRPVLSLPSAVDRMYWQVVTPNDSLVVWASPMAGRAMQWVFDRWRLARTPQISSEALQRWVGFEGASQTTIGNVYLYVGTDVNAFRIVFVSRSLLWLMIGSIVLCSTVLLVYVPSLSNPLTMVVAAVLFSGLLMVAPDAAVIVGQFSLVALVLVVVMFALRALMTPHSPSRVLKSSRPSRHREPSTQTYAHPNAVEVVLSETHPAPRGTTSEVLP